MRDLALPSGAPATAWSRRDLLRTAGRLALGAGSWAAGFGTAHAQAGPKDHRLIVHSDGPLDFETPTALLDEYLTPVESFYVRSHMATPTIQRLTAAGWRRTVAKMAGWGAPVPAEDVEPLVAFLAAGSSSR